MIRVHNKEEKNDTYNYEGGLKLGFDEGFCVTIGE